MNDNVIEILRKTIQVKVLLETNPELFDFSELESYEKVELIQSNPKKFLKIIGIENLSLDEKVQIILNVDGRVVKNMIVISEEDLNKMTVHRYLQLIEKDFRKYIRIEKYNNLSKTYQSRAFLADPIWVMSNIGKPANLSSGDLEILANRKPAFVDKFIIQEVEKYTTTYDFWKYMIKYDIKYQDIFLKSTKTVVHKTDVRNVCKLYPEMVKKIDKDTLADSKLTVKDWILLLDNIIDNNQKEFVGWDFSEELKEIFRLDATAELLSGKTKLSKRFENSIKFVLDSKDEVEIENEDQTVI